MNPVLYFLLSLSFLDWWKLAAALALADVFLRRARLIPPAVGAGLTGFLLLLFPQLAWPWQFAAFGLVTVGMWVAYRHRSNGRNGNRSMSTLYDFSVKTIDGKPQSLTDYQGHPMLLVNVASECGLTPQYEGLEKLYREFKDKGLVVLGLPCNQFGAQEPGSEAEIKQFCSLNYGVSFPLSSKLEVNGAGAHPLYAWLKGETGGADIQWNFEKFLIGKDGRVVKRYSPKTVPEDGNLKADIRSQL